MTAYLNPGMTTAELSSSTSRSCAWPSCPRHTGRHTRTIIAHQGPFAPRSGRMIQCARKHAGPKRYDHPLAGAMTREPHGATHSRRNIWLFSLDLILLAIAAGLALRAFWRPGMPIEADFLLSIYRTFALDQAWESPPVFPAPGNGPQLWFGRTALPVLSTGRQLRHARLSVVGSGLGRGRQSDLHPGAADERIGRVHLRPLAGTRSSRRAGRRSGIHAVPLSVILRLRTRRAGRVARPGPAPLALLDYSPHASTRRAAVGLAHCWPDGPPDAHPQHHGAVCIATAGALLDRHGLA